MRATSDLGRDVVSIVRGIQNSKLPCWNICKWKNNGKHKCACCGRLNLLKWIGHSQKFFFIRCLANICKQLKLPKVHLLGYTGGFSSDSIHVSLKFQCQEHSHESNAKVQFSFRLDTKDTHGLWIWDICCQNWIRHWMRHPMKQIIRRFKGSLKIMHFSYDAY